MAQTSRTILIVDDSPEDLELYRRYLLRDREYSYQIVAAALGRQGLELWQQHQPDAVLLDYRLPDLDGLEFLAKLQPSPQQSCFPVIMVTGQGNEAIAVQAMKAGAQDYLVKEQITPETLHLAVNGAIEAVQLRTQLQQRIERERLVLQITQKIHQSLDIEEILQTTVTEVRQFLGTDRVLIFRLQPDGSGTVTTESVGAGWIPLLSTSYRDPCLSEDYLEPFRQGSITLKPDIYDGSIDPCHVELLAKLQVRANLVVPILQNGQLWGLSIAHHCASPRQWQPLEIDLLKEIATQVGIALQQAELYQQACSELAERQRAEAALRQQTNRERLVAQIAQRVRQTLDLNEILQTTVEEVREFLQTDRAFIYRFQPDFSGIVVVESVGENWLPILDAQVEDRYFIETRGEDYRQGRIQAVADIYTAGLTECHVDLLARFQVRANLAVPILYGEALWGLLVANHCSAPHHWQPLEIDLLQQLTTQVGIAIQQAELYQQAQHELAQRRRTEAVLRESEERFRQLAENIDAVFWVTELSQWRVSYVSPACERLWELNPQNICDDRQTWIDLLHPDDRAATSRAFQEKAIEGTFDEEYRIVLPDGRMRWVRDRCFPLHDASGKVYRLTGIAEDITDRKQVQEALRESQALFEAFMRYIPATAYIKDEEGRYLYVNPLNEQICNRPIADWLGKTDFDLFGPQEAQQWHQNDLTSLAANGAIEVVETYQQGDGERYFLSYKFPIQLSPERRLLAGLSLDITDRKQTEFQLQESEHFIQQIAETTPGILYVYDSIEQRNIYVNQQVSKLLGYTTEQLQAMGGNLLPTLIHPEDLARVPAHLAQLQSARDNEIFELEYRMQDAKGEWRWFHTREVIFSRTAGGLPQRILGISQDITDRQQATEAIAANEARMRGFFEANLVGMLYGDIHGNIHEANDELLRIVGCTREDLQAGRLQWSDITPPEYLSLDEQAIAQARVRGACTPYEKEYIRPDGSRVSVLLGYSLVGEAREESVAFILDLTDRKQAEREAQEGKQILDALMEYVPEGITIADAPDVKIRLVSRYGQQLISGRPLEAIEGIPVAEQAQEWDIFYADGITPASNEVLPLTRAVQQGEIVTNEEWVLRRPDGTKITILCNAGPIYVNGEITGGAIVWRDISDRVLIERDRERILQQEQAAREEAERANRIKDEFLAVLSHELRSPLNPILGWTKLMQTHKFDAAKTAQALATIERNAKLQTQLIDDLLDIAKILRGKLSMNVAPVNLVFVIESAIETVRAAAVGKSILLHPVLPNIGQVCGDGARLQQIVWNLLSNAVKFTPTGGRVEIRLSLVTDRSPPAEGRSPITNDKQLITKYAQITVSDTGKGINPDFLPHIFESFRQEDASTSRKYGGLGLGLAIVRSLVEAHGGTIWARSQGEGRGATFTVQLPLLDLEMSQTDELLAQEEPDLTGIRVLTVDDEPDTRELFAVLLAQYGAEVLSVASAAEVLASLESFQPDVLLSDIGMPDIDGYALIEQVRALPPERGGQVVAIALTAYAREEDRQRTLAAGFQHHICKPIDPAKLAMVLWQLMKSTA